MSGDQVSRHSDCVSSILLSSYISLYWSSRYMRRYQRRWYVRQQCSSYYVHCHRDEKGVVWGGARRATACCRFTIQADTRHRLIGLRFTYRKAIAAYFALDYCRRIVPSPLTLAPAFWIQRLRPRPYRGQCSFLIRWLQGPNNKRKAEEFLCRMHKMFMR